MSRTAILLLHGQPGSARDWDRVASELPGQAETVAIDRPGWDGRSRAAGLAGNARAALAALDERGIDRATIVGHSFGGAVAAWLAVHHPRRVAALVLAAPAANTASLYRVDRWLAAPVLGYVASAAALSVVGSVLGLEPLRRRIATGLSVDDAYLRGAGGRLLSPSTWGSFVDEQRALVRELPVLEAHLGRIAAPTTILTGSGDTLVPQHSVLELAHQIPGARLAVLPGAGHLLPLRNAPDVAARILAADPRSAATPATCPRSACP